MQNLRTICPTLQPGQKMRTNKNNGGTKNPPSIMGGGEYHSVVFATANLYNHDEMQGFIASLEMLIRCE